ncbi:MAG: glycosyltransferase, partial [Oscillospiraceae bacterium]
MELFNFLKAQKQESNIGFSVICFVENDLYKTALNFRRHIRKNKYTNYEIIFCGNISQKTKNAFKNKKDCIFAESDNNIASAYMRGAAMATKEYYCFTRAYEIWSDNALWELADKGETADCIYTNEEIRKGKNSVQRLHKPDFSPDTLRSRDYIGALFACKAKTYKSVGGIDASYGSAALTDLRLRLMDSASFAHVDKIAVYYDEKNIQPINSEQAERALLAYLHKSDLNAKVEKIENTEDCFRIKYTVKPCLVSIIIQSHNHATELKICIDSILKYTQNDIEIIIVENGSTQAELFCLYEEYNKNDKIKLLQWDKPWSYAAINNFAVQYAKGEQLLLLNNDTEILNSEWIDELLMFSQRADVGAVGAKLLYPNGT